MSNENENEMVTPRAETAEPMDEDAAFEEGRQAAIDDGLTDALTDIARTDVPGSFVVLDKYGNEEVWFAKSADDAESDALERGVKVAAVKRLVDEQIDGLRVNPFEAAFEKHFEQIDWAIPLKSIIELAWLNGANYFGGKIAPKTQGE